MLVKEEYVEQSYFFQTYLERIGEGYSSQEILTGMKSSVLGTTDLAMAIGFLLTEIKFSGKMSMAMKKLPHYFTAFQTFIIQEAEREAGKFDFHVALQVLQKEALYRSETPTPQGIFFYQLEVLSRNRLGFDYGLEAISCDPIFNAEWREWINVTLRRQIGIVDFADLIYVRSAYYSRSENEEETTVLFGEQEGRIAWASRHRDPSFLFAALSRHLNYPTVPRIKKATEEENQIPLLKRRIEQLECKLQILEEELHGGINLEKFYVKK